MRVYFEDSRGGCFTPHKIYQAISYENDAHVTDDNGVGRYVYSGKFKEYTGPVPAGFILWGGGECPVDGHVLVDTFHCDGETWNLAADNWDWGSGDIIAYRIAEEKEVEKFEVKKGDYLTGIQELTEEQYQKAVDAFVGAGATILDNPFDVDIDSKEWKLLKWNDYGLTLSKSAKFSGVRQITYEQLTGEPLSEKECVKSDEESPMPCKEGWKEVGCKDNPHQVQQDPNGIDQHSPGAKLDLGKCKAGVLGDFSLALMAVAEVGTFGADKYTRGGWQSVENGIVRYNDAGWRHKLANDPIDQESGLLHKAHEAWNVLAELELMLRDNACGGLQTQKPS